MGTTSNLDRLLADAWEVLGRKVPETDLVLEYYQTPVKNNAGMAMVALDNRGLRHLVIPTQYAGPPRLDRRSRGIEVGEVELEVPAGMQKFVDTCCNKPHLNGLFSVIAVEVLDALSAEADPFVVVETVLNRWRELILPQSPQALGREALTGLIGELLVLKRLVELTPGSIGKWVGPERSRHDFVSEHIALEVKTLTGRTGRVVEIHGPEQLSVEGGRILALVVHRLEPDPQGDVALPDLIHALLETGVDRLLLLQKLASVGYSSVHDVQYRELRFRLRESPFFVVDEAFPKLTPTSFKGDRLPQGVLDVAYKVDLSTEPPVALTDAVVFDVLRGLAMDEALHAF